MVRLKHDQSLDAGTQALRGVQPQIREATIPERFRAEDRDQYLKEPFVLQSGAGGPSFLRSRYQRPLTTMMVVVSLVLVIACANIANLLLARASARRHEMSIRLVLGASRLRLTRQLLTESLILSACGARLGLLFANWGSRLLVRQLSTSTNAIVLDLSLDWRVLAFTTMAAIGTALLFGTAPALRAAGAEPNDALKAHGRGVLGEGRVSIAGLLVVAQVALSLVLVVAAGLFVRTFARLATMDVGFDRNPVLVVNMDAPPAGTAADDRPALFERLRQAAGAVPGVSSAAVSVVTPVSGSTWQFLIDLPDKPNVPEGERGAHVNFVSPDFFRTLGTEMIGGRDFTTADCRGGAGVAVVNEAFAKKFFDGQVPVGQIVRQPAFPGRPAEEREVVRYVQDAVYRSLRSPIPPTLYMPASQQFKPGPGMSLTVRSESGAPARLIRSVAAALTSVDRSLTHLGHFQK